MNQITAISGILILASLVEALVEYFIAPVGDSIQDDHWRDLAMRYIAALVGVALSCVYGADLLALLGLDSPWPWVGWVVTGLLIGRGANWVHDFAGRWLGRPYQ